MDNTIFQTIEDSSKAGDISYLFESLESELKSAGEYHQLFNVLLLKKKVEFGLPLSRPSSFDDVPENLNEEFEKYYISVAREVGQLLLDNDQISQGWIYFRTILEPEKVANKIKSLDLTDADPEFVEDLIKICLYESADPVLAFEIMLKTRGTCNTITVFDQSIQHLDSEITKQVAALLLSHLYQELIENILYHYEREEKKVEKTSSLKELIEGQDWLYENDNYHIDVSHLNAVVRFSRLLNAESGLLSKAVELSQYGKKLAEPFRYPGDAPFEDYYLAHENYFLAQIDQDRESALNYFKEKLKSSDEDDHMMAAFVYAELLLRCDKINEALELIETELSDVDEIGGKTYSQWALEAGGIDRLKENARKNGDYASFLAAVLESLEN
jgi:hypothetical protein